ncbi:MAG TPA: DUF6580 family putative transport protein [Patescibacteria group bacterium]|nr:DUF6580 family putative transport protein [Patescibacteria group bacterium]
MAYIIIFIGAFLRVLPHAANFAPLGAIALFGGTYLNKKLAIVVPIAAMIISDFFIGFDSLESRLSVYGSLALIAGIGMLVRRRKNIITVIGGAVGSSITFFLITNCVLFYAPTMYAHNLSGQIASYVNGLPFLRPTLLSDLLYTAVFFGSYELIQAWAKRRAAYVKNY